MNMREYRSGDLESVMALGNLAWKEIRKYTRETLGYLLDLSAPPPDDEYKGLQVKEQIDCQEYEIAVCEHEGQIVGFITWRINGTVAEICNNAALPGSGLKGIGQMMYQHVFDHARQAGARLVQVTTGLDPAHAPARRAYERAGFEKHLDYTTYFMEL